MTIFGWDASDYDWSRGPMDLAAAARAGIAWFTHKATEATTVVHRRYGEALRRARDAGIPVLGAYHVVRSPRNAAQEVDHWLSYVDKQTPWWRDWPLWIWQVDLEKWPYDAVPADEGESVADLIEARTGRRAVIYASRGQYGGALTGTSHELWNADYGANTDGDFREVYTRRGGDHGPGWAAYSGRTPVFWQYGSRTTIGSQRTCDANAFRGSLDQLVALVKGDDDVPDFSPGDARDIAFTLLRAPGGPTHAVLGNLAQVTKTLAADVAALKVRPAVAVTLSAEDRAAIVADLLAAIGPGITAMAASGARQALDGASIYGATIHVAPPPPAG